MTVQPTVRVADDAHSAAAYLRRMGCRSWSEYAGAALATSLTGRRRGATGIVLRRLTAPLVFGSASKPVLLEDVDVRGGRRVHLGHAVMLEQRVMLDCKTSSDVGIRLGDRVAIRTGTLIDTGYEGSVAIGAGSTIGAFCELRGSGHLTLGRDCLLARNVMIVTSEHRMDDLTATISSQGITPAPTVIEDGVWLGANVLVRAGITVGAGAVIGANSVVTRDVAPGTVAVGAPARAVRRRGRQDAA